MAVVEPATEPIGDLLRSWRQRRRMSQLDLALEAEISTRHLSFLETGKSQPSRNMVLRLADHLDLPLRDRNRLLLAAGYAPVYSEYRLDDPELESGRRAVQLVLAGHEPYPALAVDRHWQLVMHNQAAAIFLVNLPPELQQPPVNVLRVALHPEGLMTQTVNGAEVRAHLLHRLRHQVAASADPVLTTLLEEVAAYPGPPAGTPLRPVDSRDVVTPIQLQTPLGVLSLISTTTVFGTPVDITLAELAIESFFPADTASATILQTLAASAQSPNGG